MHACRVEIYPVAVASAIANVPSTTALSDMALLRHGGTPGTTVLSSDTAIAVAADAARHILCDGFYTVSEASSPPSPAPPMGFFAFWPGRY